MRRLTIIVFILAALYSGYWFVGASAVERGAVAQLDDLEESGWTVTYDDVSTAGFPSRFDTTATNLDLVSPDGSMNWMLPFAQALTLSYKPNEIIVALPPSQTITADGTPILITSDGLRASMNVAPTPALSLNALTAEVGVLTATANQQRLFSITSGLAALRAAETGPHSYDAFLDLDGFALPDELRRMLDPQSTQPSTFGQITVDAGLVLDADIDRHSAKSQPQLDQIDLHGMTVSWGTLQLRGDGQIDVGTDGYPTGQLTLTAENWRDILPIAVNAGVLTSSAARNIQSVAGLFSGGSTTLKMPINFANQRMMLGPIPIGNAPKLR